MPWYHESSYIILPSLPLLFPFSSARLFLVTGLLALLPTPKPSNPTAGILRTASHAAAGALHAIDCALSVPAKWALALDRSSLLVLAASLGAVDALLRSQVADGLSEPALAYLAADEVVDAVLEVIDLIYAGDLRLLELFC